MARAEKAGTPNPWICNAQGGSRICWIYLLAPLLVLFLHLFGEPPRAQEPARFRLGYSALSLSFLPHLIARDAGIFQKQGIEIELIQMAGPLQVAALAAGELDFGSGLTPALLAAARGLPVRGVLVTVKTPLFYIVAEPTIMRLEDLAGKRMAVDTIGSLQPIVARLILAKRGVNPERISYFQTGSVSNSIAALSGRTVSAAMLSIPTNVVMAQKGFRQLASSQEANISYPPSGLTAQVGKFQKETLRMKRVMSAVLDSIRFIHEQREWTADYIRRTWKIEPRTAEETYRLALPTFPLNGKMNFQELQEFLDTAFENKQIQRKTEAQSVMDYSLLDEILKERGL
ncbi:MAG: ABC transporter substrate-binding protein [Deltaproteobacteria bacterium]|nr:ABC transporter substrate-binding protein [Deltaproteobacteria bacterium]